MAFLTASATEPRAHFGVLRRDSGGSVASSLPTKYWRAHGDRRKVARYAGHSVVKCCEGSPSEEGENKEELVTVGDAVREWIAANERSEAPKDAVTSESGGRVSVLFVDLDNRSVSVAAEAIFVDLVERRGLQEKIFCYSAGVDATVGAPVDSRFQEALMFRRKLDISAHSAVEFEPQDLSSYDLVVCMDERTRSQIIYMTAGTDGKHEIQVEDKIRLLSSYCMDERLRSIQFPTNSQYSREALKLALSTIVDACSGLLRALIEESSGSE